MNAENSRAALLALRQKYPCGVGDVGALSDEQRAWLQIKMQALADGARPSQIAVRLQKIRSRLVHATEDIPAAELQRMVSFVFGHLYEIDNLIENNGGRV